MKKIILSILLCISMLMPMSAFSEENPIKVFVDGEALQTEVAPQLVNGRTMLPMRAIFEALDAKVTWIEEEQLIFATKGKYFIVLQIENPIMSIQTTDSVEEKKETLDTAPFIYEGRTLVPARAVAEALEAEVNWEAETRSVFVTTKSEE